MERYTLSNGQRKLFYFEMLGPLMHLSKLKVTPGYYFIIEMVAFTKHLNSESILSKIAIWSNSSSLFSPTLFGNLFIVVGMELSEKLEFS